MSTFVNRPAPTELPNGENLVGGRAANIVCNYSGPHRGALFAVRSETRGSPGNCLPNGNPPLEHAHYYSISGRSGHAAVFSYHVLHQHLFMEQIRRLRRVLPIASMGLAAAVLCAAGRPLSVVRLVAQSKSTRPPAVPATPPVSWADEDRAIAVRFAPIFHQGIVGDGRFDYPANFDFDGDWVGGNNWEHAADTKYPLKGYVYYAVSETPTHYYIHYAVFHPRDTKGGETTGVVLSKGVRAGATAAQRVKRTGVADDVVLAHENDFEGCLVVAEKQGRRRTRLWR